MWSMKWQRGLCLCAGQALLVIIGINTGGNPKLPKIIHTTGVIGFGLGAAQGGQQQARQDPNDRNPNKQLNERKGNSKVPKSGRGRQAAAPVGPGIPGLANRGSGGAAPPSPAG